MKQYYIEAVRSSHYLNHARWHDLTYPIHGGGGAMDMHQRFDPEEPASLLPPTDDPSPIAEPN